jgi:long-chain acyl-CoA synthetase
MEQAYREKGDTWPKILKYNYEKYGDRRRAMRHKHYGVWQPHTWKDYYLNVKHMALGLLTLGFEPGDKVLIIGDNAPQWYYAELATQANHGLSVGLFAELLPSEIKYIAENCEARFAVVEGQEQVDKFLEIKDALPLLKKVAYWNYKGLAHYEDDTLIGYRELLTRGKNYDAGHSGVFEHNVKTGKADDECAVIYTAGTAGAAPKGAVHTFRTLKAGADFLLQLDPWFENDNVVPYLPPVWINEQWIGVGCHLLSAATLNFAEASETQQRDSRETGPSIVFYGARLWESQAAAVQARILGADAVKRFAYRLFMPVGYKTAELKYSKKKPNLISKMLYYFADCFLFRSIRRSLGLSNARICYTTGAILSPDAFRFYHALDIPLKSLYGTTEGGVIAGAGNDEIHFETVGPAHRAAEIKIGANGEIVYRHAGIFSGYYKDPEATAAVLKDGWFHSGDSGSIRDDGHLVFIDRLEDVVELAGECKVAPQFMESRLRSSPHIKDAWILAGPQSACLAAIIVIDYENVSRWAGQSRLAFTSFAELSQTPEVYELIKMDIQRLNRTAPAGSTVKKFINLHREFDPDEGELTRTRNLRRSFLAERYRNLVDAINNDNDTVPAEDRGGNRDGRTAAIETSLRIQSVGGSD